MQDQQKKTGCSRQLFMGSIGCSVLSLTVLPLLCIFIFVVMVIAGGSMESSYLEEVTQSGNTDNKVVVLDLDGVIMDVEDGFHAVSITQYMLDALDAAGYDDTVKAVIIKMNTPGGSVYDSARIENKINELQAKDILVLSVIESMSASGGYWIAASTDRIFIQPESITGSIGVLFQSLEYDELLNKIGLEQIVITNKEAINKVPKDMGNKDNPQRAPFDEMLTEDFNAFLQIIIDGRGLTREEILPYADGRIVSGTKAVDIKFADELGGYPEALDYIQATIGTDDFHIIEYTWTELIGFNAFGAKLNKALTINDSLGHAGGQVLAMPEFYFGSAE